MSYFHWAALTMSMLDPRHTSKKVGTLGEPCEVIEERFVSTKVLWAARAIDRSPYRTLFGGTHQLDDLCQLYDRISSAHLTRKTLARGSMK